MSRTWMFALIAACGGGGGDDGIDARIDSPPSNCQAIPAQGQLTRRQGNPRLAAGTMFADGLVDIRISDPDVHFDGTRYQLYYAADHAMTFTDTSTPVIRHATSVDRITWTVDDAPVLEPSPDAGAWDHLTVGAPSVVENPAAPADRRFLMLYAGASGTLAGRTAYSIGAAVSPDGVTFTRVGTRGGLVLSGAEVYPSDVGAIAGDPDVAIVDGVYHVFFTSFACAGASCGTTTELGVAHATSTDGITWTVVEAPVLSLLRASADRTSGGGQPSVIYDADHCRWELWQTSDVAADVANQPVDLANMAGVWKAESTDGLSWNARFTGSRDFAWNPASPPAGEKLGMHTGADVAQNGGGRLMLYVGFDDQNVPAGFVLPDRTTGTRPGVMTMNVATRDLP